MIRVFVPLAIALSFAPLTSGCSDVSINGPGGQIDTVDTADAHTSDDITSGETDTTVVSEDASTEAVTNPTVGPAIVDLSTSRNVVGTLGTDPPLLTAIVQPPGDTPGATIALGQVMLDGAAIGRFEGGDSNLFNAELDPATLDSGAHRSVNGDEVRVSLVARFVDSSRLVMRAKPRGASTGLI